MNFRITMMLAAVVLLLSVIACGEATEPPTPTSAPLPTPTSLPLPTAAPTLEKETPGVAPPAPTPTLEERAVQTPTDFGYNTRVVDGDIHVWHAPHCPPVPPATFVAPIILTDLRSYSYLHLKRDGTVTASEYRDEEGRERFAEVLEDSDLMKLIFAPFECP